MYGVAKKGGERLSGVLFLQLRQGVLGPRVDRLAVRVAQGLDVPGLDAVGVAFDERPEGHELAVGDVRVVRVEPVEIEVLVLQRMGSARARASPADRA